MEKYNAVGWFEIPVKDMDRAKTFYEKVFDIKLERQEEQFGILMSWFPMDPEAKGAAGTLVLAEGYEPSEKGVMIYFTYPDMEKRLEMVPEAGGEIVAPKYSIGEHGFVAKIKDTEGNLVALHSMK